MLNHAGALVLFVQISALIFLPSCKQSTQSAVSRSKDGPASGLNLRFALLASQKQAGMLQLTQIITNATVDKGAKPSEIEISFPAVSTTKVDLSRVAQKKITLATLDSKLVYKVKSSTLNASNLVECNQVSLKIGANSSDVYCGKQDPNGSTGTDYKVPTSLDYTLFQVWTSLLESCKTSNNRPYGNDADKTVIGCNCATPGKQIPFASYNDMAMGSPESAVQKFSEDCGSKSTGSSLQALVAVCVNAPILGFNRDGVACVPCSDMELNYAEYLNRADPEKSFRDQIRSLCNK